MQATTEQKKGITYSIVPTCVAELEDWWQSFRKCYSSCLENSKVDAQRCGDCAAGLLRLWVSEKLT